MTSPALEESCYLGRKYTLHAARFLQEAVSTYPPGLPSTSRSWRSMATSRNPQPSPAWNSTACALWKCIFIWKMIRCILLSRDWGTHACNKVDRNCTINYTRCIVEVSKYKNDAQWTAWFIRYWPSTRCFISYSFRYHPPSIHSCQVLFYLTCKYMNNSH